jgi:DNA repair protein RadA/Sms
MSKQLTRFVCQSCGSETARWAGRCANCGEWNSLVEELLARTTKRGGRGHKAAAGHAVPLTDIDAVAERRILTSIPELDRVLGGGIVPGSVVLVGGDPGIGKSTLMLQMAVSLKDRVILYITGEESPAQVRLRAERLESPPGNRILLLTETNVESIEALVDKQSPGLMIVDSIQTMVRPDLDSAPGTVSQVREATGMFTRMAKTRGVPIFLVGHVTKEGMIAGPRVIEHMVDTVLQFEGERHSAYRILRAMKNRFGSTNEIGVFEMRDTGLREVANPSEVFLSERSFGTSGSAVVAGMEGTRPILLEVQALAAPTSYGVPQRTATGFDGRRLQMLLAVLERRAGLHMGQYDVFVNVAGGVRIDEPAADLGMALSIVSSVRDVPADSGAVVIGEVGLGGEIRRVSHAEKRVAEARKLGFTRVILPARNLSSQGFGPGLELTEVETIGQAIAALLGAS